MSIMNPAYIEELTGIDSTLIPQEAINVAEDHAKYLIGYLEKEEDKVTNIFLFGSTAMINVNEPMSEVTKLEYRSAVGDYTELVEDTDFRWISSKSTILLDSSLPENTEVQITYDLGWDADDVPPLVRLLISILAVNIVNQFQPGSIETGAVQRKKLGDYEVQYNLTGLESSNIFGEDSIDRMVKLIKQGSFEPTVLI